MREIYKRYEIDGFIQDLKEMKMVGVPFYVHLTRDKRGCTVSIAPSDANIPIQFSIPFDKVIKDLES